MRTSPYPPTHTRTHLEQLIALQADGLARPQPPRRLRLALGPVRVLGVGRPGAGAGRACVLGGGGRDGVTRPCPTNRWRWGWAWGGGAAAVAAAPSGAMLHTCRLSGSLAHISAAIPVVRALLAAQRRARICNKPVSPPTCRLPTCSHFLAPEPATRRLPPPPHPVPLSCTPLPPAPAAAASCCCSSLSSPQSVTSTV